MAPLLQSATTPSDGQAIVTVRGDLDTDTALQLWQYLSYLIGQVTITSCWTCAG